MLVSIEIPVIRGGWLVQCIDSVLAQTSRNWVLSLRWDEGDELAREILDRLAALENPNIAVYTGERLGIARSRQYLSERSRGDLILPLDDDDLLEPEAVERFIFAAMAQPWAGIIRARRVFIDQRGAPVRMADWFPFERRHYFRGATQDISNHAQPYVIRRGAFLAAGGWTGFDQTLGMGEDCGCFATMEEQADIGLLDAVLYRYRLHDTRTSHRLTDATVEDLWRQIADRAVARRRAPVIRVSHRPPFAYAETAQVMPSLDDVEVVIPFYETDRREIPYSSSRPGAAVDSSVTLLAPYVQYAQRFDPPLPALRQISASLSTTAALSGDLVLALFSGAAKVSPDLVVRRRLDTSAPLRFEFIGIEIPSCAEGLQHIARMELTFEPALGAQGDSRVLLHTLRTSAGEVALMRFFQDAPGYCRRGLQRCLVSVWSAGIRKDAVHVIESRASSAANRNAGIRKCTAPWVLFMDDDAELAGPATLPALFDALIRMEAQLAGPKLLSGSGLLYSGLPEVDPLLRETRVGGMGEKDIGQYDFDEVAPWLPSTVLLVHRSVLQATGGFDERFEGSQHEDADFTLRARDRGFDCCYAGSATAIHYNELRNTQFSKNSAYLAERWKNRPDLFTYPITRSQRSMRTAR
jgi:glycosyltransferase involved in cell wall biosynthesis